MDLTLKQALVIAAAQEFVFSGARKVSSDELKSVVREVADLMIEIGQPDQLNHGQLLVQALEEIRDSE